MKVWIERRRAPKLNPLVRFVNLLTGRNAEAKREFVGVSVRRMPQGFEIPSEEIAENADGLRVWRR